MSLSDLPGLFFRKKGPTQSLFPVCTVQTRHLHGSNASFARFKPFVCTVQTGRLHGPNLRFSGFQCFFPYPGRLPEIFCCPDFSVCVCAGSSLRSRVRVASGAGACPFSEDPLPGLLVPYRPFTGSGRCLPGYGLSEVSAFAPDVLFVSVAILLWRCGRLRAPAEDLFPLPRYHPVVRTFVWHLLCFLRSSPVPSGRDSSRTLLAVVLSAWQ